MKKILALVLVMMLAMVAMTACSKTAPTPAATEAPTEAPAADAPAAPGTAGKLKLYDVEPKTAAMLMAIVADKMGKPLNELRFISIKEVK